MTRLEKLLLGEENDIWFPEDVLRLKQEIPELAALPDGIVQRLYSDWGEDTMCASWLSINEYEIAAFAAYLREEV